MTEARKIKGVTLTGAVLSPWRARVDVRFDGDEERTVYEGDDVQRARDIEREWLERMMAQ